MFPKRFYTADEEARAKAFDMFPSLEVALDALTCIEAEVNIHTEPAFSICYHTYIQNINHLLPFIIIVVISLVLVSQSRGEADFRPNERLVLHTYMNMYIVLHICTCMHTSTH